MVIMTGMVVESPVQPGMWIELPKSMSGPGRVVIETMEFVRFADGHQELAICISSGALDNVPTFETSRLHGCTLEVFG